MIFLCNICETVLATKRNLVRHLENKETKEYQLDPITLYAINKQLHELYPSKYSLPKCPAVVAMDNFMINNPNFEKDLMTYLNNKSLVVETNDCLKAILSELKEIKAEFKELKGLLEAQSSKSLTIQNNSNNTVNTVNNINNNQIIINNKQEIHLHCYKRVDRSMLDEQFLLKHVKNIPMSAVDTFEKIYLNPEFPQNQVFYKLANDTNMIETFTQNGWVSKNQTNVIMNHYYQREYLAIFSALLDELYRYKTDKNHEAEYEKLQSLLFNALDDNKSDITAKIVKSIIENSNKSIYKLTNGQKIDQTMIHDNNKRFVPGLSDEANSKIYEPKMSPQRLPSPKKITIKKAKAN